MALFTTAKYKSNIFLPDLSQPIIGFVKIQPQTTSLVIGGNDNTSVDANISTTVPIRVTSTRKAGIIARHVVIGDIRGTAPNERIVYRRVVIFDPDVFDVMVSLAESTITYEGVDTWQLLGAQQERYRLITV